MLPGWFVVFSVGIRLVSGGRYAWGVMQGKARPNPITWLLWGCTPLIAFFAGLPSGLDAQSFVLLALGLSPLTTSFIAFKKFGVRPYLTPFTISCTVFALLGIVLWRITSQPVIAISFSMAADLAAGLPTVRKAYEDPSSEYPLPYLLSIVSMAITLSTIRDWSFTVYAFPLYMLLTNVMYFTLAAFPLRKYIRVVLARRSGVLEPQ